MVATSMHYITGIVIAWLFGKKQSSKYWWGLFGALPDLDAIFFFVAMILSRIFSFSLDFLEHNQTAVWLLAHRGFSHSLLLFALGIGVMFAFKVHKKIILIVGLMWASHLFLDMITAWKWFPLLPFSYASVHLGVVEIFDSILVFLFICIYALFFGMSILQKEKKIPLVFSFIFVVFFGFVTAIFMSEFNIQTVVLSGLVFGIILGIALYCKSVPALKKHWMQKWNKGIYSHCFIIIGYLALLIGCKFYYVSQTGASFSELEPLEEFAFNWNAHTFEIDSGDYYRIGIITLRGIEEESTVQKYQDFFGGLTPEVIEEYTSAYSKALNANWLNFPVYSFYQDEEGALYANIRYAKSYLENPHMPGPRNGIKQTLNNGLMVHYGEGWFD